MSEGFLREPLLEATGARHGFGLRQSPKVDGLRRPRQVHGTRVVELLDPAAGDDTLGEADAVISGIAGQPVGVLTADCVPVLLASRSGSAVAAIHAGWRGLAAGIVAAGARALAGRAGGEGLVAGIGPHIGPCCYEVDAPVADAMRARFHDAAAPALQAVRPGHWMLALAELVAQDLEAAGIARDEIGLEASSCTRCHAARFHSFRRDAERAGRMVHWVAAVDS